MRKLIAAAFLPTVAVLLRIIAQADIDNRMSAANSLD
jgi:hypothetical protein